MSGVTTTTGSESRPEFWKTFERDGRTFGFSWFPTWPSVRRVRWPFGFNSAEIFVGESVFDEGWRGNSTPAKASPPPAR